MARRDVALVAPIENGMGSKQHAGLAKLAAAQSQKGQPNAGPERWRPRWRLPSSSSNDPLVDVTIFER